MRIANESSDSILGSHNLDFAPVVSLALTGFKQRDLMRAPLMPASDRGQRHHEEGMLGHGSTNSAMLSDELQMSRLSVLRRTIG